MRRIGFVGLGTMGAPMAGHLARNGFEVTVWNRTPEKAHPLREAGARVAADLPQLAAACEAIAICVGRTEDVGEVLSQLAPSAAPGTLFIDHSTIEPAGAKAFALDLEHAGHAFLDAPVTGGSMGAKNGTLTIFVGGPEAAFERARPVLAAYGKRVERVGENGAGQMMKLANQIAVGGALLALCESLAFAERAGLDVALAREMIGGGAAGSWAFENYGPKILARDWTPGFSVKNQRKDFGYCLAAAEALGLEIPGTALVDDLLSELELAGRGEDTTAALIDVYRRAVHPA